MTATHAQPTQWWRWLLPIGYLAALAGALFWVDHRIGWKNASYWAWLGYLFFLMAGTLATLWLSRRMKLREISRGQSDEQRKARLAEQRERIMSEARERVGRTSQD